ncbi:uncharacterized protein LOC124416071 [Diprion similis]|uniref:uncharacterized protein LOC124416071 n=1 Tax=Diprion similis TaxID=362088 RepID=UPI001EF7B7CF|nr:uncharacterized protein LOC124416071 [Diprion similis]
MRIGGVTADGNGSIRLSHLITTNPASLALHYLHRVALDRSTRRGGDQTSGERGSRTRALRREAVYHLIRPQTHSSSTHLEGETSDIGQYYISMHIINAIKYSLLT